MALLFVILVIFAFIALLVPFSLLLFSKLIRKRAPVNKAATTNFESAEKPVGAQTSIMTEYFHYFTGFLAFEIVGAIVLLWVYSEPSLSQSADYYFFGFLLFAILLGYFMIMLASRKGERNG